MQNNAHNWLTFFMHRCDWFLEQISLISDRCPVFSQHNHIGSKWRLLSIVMFAGGRWVGNLDSYYVLVHCGASTLSWCFLIFSFGSPGYQLGCTIAAVSAQRPVEHVKNALQNIKIEQTPQSLYHNMQVNLKLPSSSSPHSPGTSHCCSAVALAKIRERSSTATISIFRSVQ